jgi:hypothetical protein
MREWLRDTFGDDWNGWGADLALVILILILAALTFS